jgi:hypothetical protein
MREDQTRRCCCSLRKASTVWIGIAHPESLQKRSVWLIRLSVCRLHYPPPHLLTSITDPPHLDYFHYGGWGGTWELSFFLSLRACVSKGYVKVLKYTGALVSAYLSLTLISACPSLLLTLGDSMTDEKVHHTEVCCCCCFCCCF